MASVVLVAVEMLPALSMLAFDEPETVRFGRL